MNKEEIDLLEIVFTLAIGECAYNDINNIQKLEDKIKTINNLCKKQKEVIDKANKLLKEKVKVIPFDENGEGGGLELTDYDIQDLLDILKEVE